MITYVNSVFVSNNAAAISTNPATIQNGQFIIMYKTKDGNTSYDTTALNNVIWFKIGMGTDKTTVFIDPATKASSKVPLIRWSNEIHVKDIRSTAILTYKDDTEESVKIDFTGVDASTIAKFADGGKRIIVRLTFKDLPTRFRKWTESYEYVTLEGDTTTTIATNIANQINKEFKRARVTAEADGGVITLTAMPYDDDDAVETLNWAEKVRFNANVYYTDPAAEGWESKNKFFPKGLKIEKTPGYTYPASAKLVRDREAQSFGYMGVLNQGDGTWPIIRPAMNTKLDGQYNAYTIMFENQYRAADDITRRTKQEVEIYATSVASINGIADMVTGMLNGAVHPNGVFADTVTEAPIAAAAGE